MPAELADSLTATDADRLLQAEDVVRNYCGWHIAPSRTGVTYTTDVPCGQTRLYLPTLQLTALTDIDIVGALTTFDSTAWTWHASGWVEPSPGHFWPTARAGSRLIVTFTHGYVTPPPSVEGTVQAIAQRGVSNPGGLSRQQAGPFVDDYSALLSSSDRTALAPYVIPLV